LPEDTQVRFKRTKAVHSSKGKRRSRNTSSGTYSVCRVWMPEDVRPRGTQIDSSGVTRAIQDALEEEGYSEGVMVAAVKGVENRKLFVLALTVYDSVDNKGMLYACLDRIVNSLNLKGDTLFYEPSETSSTRVDRRMTVRRPKRLRMTAAGGFAR
jgi:hypothetical protein